VKLWAVLTKQAKRRGDPPFIEAKLAELAALGEKGAVQ
jgi:hypothetical protein